MPLALYGSYVHSSKLSSGFLSFGKAFRHFPEKAKCDCREAVAFIQASSVPSTELAHGEFSIWVQHEEDSHRAQAVPRGGESFQIERVGNIGS